jgi:hypothetical protein
LKASLDKNIALNASCTTCEGTGSAEDKYACLNASQEDLQKNQPTLVESVIRMKKTLYELRGHELTQEQREQAHELYVQYSNINPICATPVESSDVLQPALSGATRLCQTLNASHIPVELRSLELPYCFDAWAQLRSSDAIAKPTPTAEESADLERMLGVMAKTNGQLLKSQLSFLGSDEADPPLRISLGDKARQLYFLDRWYKELAATLGASPEQPEPESLRQELNGMMGQLWSAWQNAAEPYDALETAFSETTSPSSDSVTDALKAASQNGFAMEQDVLRVAFTPLGTLEPDGIRVDGLPLHGLPLLLLTGDALTPLAQRVGNMAVFHDFGCLFKTCNRLDPLTPTVGLFRLLASVDSGGTVPGYDPLIGWRAAFEAIQRDHSSPSSAYLEAVRLVTGGSERLTDRSFDELPASAHPLAKILVEAGARVGSYDATGELDSTGHNALWAGMNASNKAQVLDDIESINAGLDHDLHDYASQYVELAKALITEKEMSRTKERIKEQAMEVALRYDQLSSDIDGLLGAGDEADRRYDNLFAGYAGIKSVVDTTGYFETQGLAPFEIRGQDAKFMGRNGPVSDPTAVAFTSITEIEGGKMVAVQTSGQWSPVCALRKTSIIDTSDAMTGPEGFMVVDSTGTYQSRSTSTTGYSDAGLTLGVKAEVCVGSADIPFVPKISVCAYADSHASTGMRQERSGSEGSETRTSASFSRGFTLPNTPYPSAPVGSLLLVITDSDTNELYDVRVLRAPYSTVLLPAAGDRKYDVHFVVNDRGDCVGGDDSPLTVKASILQSRAPAVQSLLNAMSSVLANIRARESQFVRQGRLLPSDMASLRSEATSELSKVHFDDFPKPLHDLFYSFLDKELLRLERAVEIQAIERAQELLRVEMNGLIDEANSADDTGRLVGLIPSWTARNLDGAMIRYRTEDLIKRTRNYFMPVLKLWYPEVVQNSTELRGAITNLLNTPLDASVVEQATRVQNALRGAVNACRTPGPVFGSTTIALSIPNVDWFCSQTKCDGFCADGTAPKKNGTNCCDCEGVQEDCSEVSCEATTCPNGFEPTQVGNNCCACPVYPETEWRGVGLERAKNFWDAACARAKGTLTINPEDLYLRHGGGGGALSCIESMPVIRSMAIYFVRTEAQDNVQLTDLHRRLEMTAANTSSFATIDGPSSYTIENALLQKHSLRILYGTETEIFGKLDDSKPVAAAGETPADGIGLSPFSSFTFDFAALKNMRGSNGICDKGSNNNPSAMVLVMDIDTRKALDFALDWIDTCCDPETTCDDPEKCRCTIP